MSSIEAILEKNSKLLDAKNIKPLFEKLDSLPLLDCEFSLKKAVEVRGDIGSFDREVLEEFAKELKPWRKGPFSLFDIYIDSEWDSSIKYSLIEEFLDIEDKDVADVGCNNGYYMFQMLKKNPKSIIGFDPSALFKLQFELLNRYIKSDIKYELLGIQDLPLYPKKFDLIVSLGVIYHRIDPIGAIKSLAKSLKKDGEIIVDTIYIDGDLEMALVPKNSYAKMSNVYFVPTINAFKNMLQKGGFRTIELIAKKETNSDEQRKTCWVEGNSLEDFLDSSGNLTIEGYEKPKRAYFRCRR